MGSSINLIGKTFGRLTVTSLLKERNKHMNKIWECSCECGKKTNVTTNALNSGKVNSCGCLALEIRTKHGKNRTKVYVAWQGMKDRCFNANNIHYDRYGGRGITVSQDWLSFENFYRDMGDPNTNKHELDRIDNEKGYCKENCRWTTRSINNHNRGSEKNSTSEYKGVYKAKGKRAWVASCYSNGVLLRSRYLNEKEAAIAYNVYSLFLFGEFAYQNKVKMTPNEIAELIERYEI